MNNTTLKVTLQTLSPIHIGCDETYEPTNFIIDEENLKLVEFDPLKYVEALNSEEKEKLIKISKSDNLQSIFQFFKSAYKPTIGGRMIDVARSIAEKYKKEIILATRFDQKRIINQFKIEKTSYNKNSHLPFLPGSSIKGAIRTAYISSLAMKKEIRKYWMSPGKLKGNDLGKDYKIYKKIRQNKLANALEQELLEGKFDTDPFSLIKVSDFNPVGNVSTKIMYAVNKKKNPNSYSAKGVTQILEVIPEGSIFTGFINIQKPLSKKSKIREINKDILFETLSDFYETTCENECTQELIDIGMDSSVLNQIEAENSSSNNNQSFLLRIGRHSGAESMTIENNRFIKIRQGNDNPEKYLDHATTIWLATENQNAAYGLKPFGWVELNIGENANIVKLKDRPKPIDKLQARKPTNDEIQSLMKKFNRK